MNAATDRTSRTITVEDGRTLSYAEYGEPTSPALFLFHGLPGSRLSATEMWLDEPSSVRVVAPDRPGFGRSSRAPGRTLADWARDVERLADSLGVEQFRVAGFSGGGPHALAVAHALGGRVIAAASISGAASVDTPGVKEGMNRINRLIFTLARVAPALLWLVAAPHARGVKRHPMKELDRSARDKGIAAADREVMTDPRLRALMAANAAEPFHHGVRGFISEAHLLARPWGFDPATITPPVSFWHGDADTNVPVAMARHLARVVPRSTLRIFEGEGHLIVPRHFDEILGALLAEGDATA